MIKEGVIYQFGGPEKGTVFVKRESRLRFVPRAFFLGGIFGILILFSPLIFMEVRYRLSSLLEKQIVVKPTVGFAEIIRRSDIAILEPVNPQFSLVIPKIGLNSEIFANVSLAEKEDYDAFLKKGVAHASGSYFPGQNGTVYLFGHSTDYVWNLPQFQAVFYLLKELQEGDRINLFYQGKRYIYEVADKKLVSPTDLSYLKPKSGEEEVILQTCWPPGTTWKRLLVFGRPINIDKET